MRVEKDRGRREEEEDGATDEMIPFASHENARPEPEEEADCRTPRLVALSRLASGKSSIGDKIHFELVRPHLQ